MCPLHSNTEKEKDSEIKNSIFCHTYDHHSAFRHPEKLTQHKVKHEGYMFDCTLYIDLSQRLLQHFSTGCCAIRANGRTLRNNLPENRHRIDPSCENNSWFHRVVPSEGCRFSEKCFWKKSVPSYKIMGVYQAVISLFHKFNQTTRWRSEQLHSLIKLMCSDRACGLNKQR